MPTLDLHGYRFDEARAAVLKFIDTLVASGEPVGRVIHGFGVLADALPGWAREYPFVTRVEREPGNAGATLVWVEAG